MTYVMGYVHRIKHTSILREGGAGGCKPLPRPCQATPVATPTADGGGRRKRCALQHAFASSHSRICRCSVWLGARKVCTSASPVIGLVDLVASQRSIADHSYERPSAAITGSLMSSVVIGQMKSAGGSSSLGAGASAAEDGPCSSAVRLPSSSLALSSSAAASSASPAAALGSCDGPAPPP